MEQTIQSEEREFKKAVKRVKEVDQSVQGSFKKKRFHTTIKNKKIIDGIVSGKGLLQSMRDAGYTKQSAISNCTRKMKELAPKIIEIMDRAGLSDDHLVEKLKKGIEAKKVSYFQKAGKVTDERVDDDLMTAHKYIETSLKLRGHLKEKLDVNVNVDLADRIAQARRALYAKEREIDVTPEAAVG